MRRFRPSVALLLRGQSAASPAKTTTTSGRGGVMGNVKPCRYFWLAIVATVVSTVSVYSSTGSYAMSCVFGILGGGALGWFASSADAEVRRG
jgi:hypothetical protein